MERKSLKILHSTNRDFLQLNYVRRDEKYGKVAFCRFQQSLGPFGMFFVEERPFKRDFTDIYLITFFGDGNLGYTSAIRIIVFSRMFKI